MTRLPLWLAPAVLVAGMSLCAQDAERYSFAAIGDLPYSPVANGRQVYPAPPFERLIASINSDRRVRFTLHVGDIKAGSTLCEDEVYWRNLQYFESFRQPLILTPGDNEWTDCHRANNGEYNPLERLAFLRQIYFSEPHSLGARKMPLLQQSAETRYAQFRENSLFSMGPVLYAMVHVVGSNNNRGRRTGPFQDPNDAEYTERNAASVAWVNQAFATAAANPRIVGVVIASQANVFENYGAGATSGFVDFVQAMRRNTLANPRLKVLYVMGDSHYFRLDRPLTPDYPTATNSTPNDNAIMNFLRLEVYGEGRQHWVRVEVDRRNPDLFSFSPVTVSGN